MPTPKWRFLLAAAALSVLTPTVVSSATYTVRKDGSGDFYAIKDAADYAADNDSIDVGPGSYREHVEIDKSLAIIATSGQAVTIWDGLGTGVPADIYGPYHLYLDGFTITRGFAGSGGALGIRDGGSATVKNCVFHSNRATYDGGCFMVKGAGSRLELSDCLFINNHADHNSGAGLVILGGTLSISNCVFMRNTTDTFSGAICVHASVLDVSNSLFWENTSGDVAGAIYAYKVVGGSITNCTFYRNGASGGIAGTVVVHDSPAIVLNHNIIAEEQSRFGLYYLGGSGTHSCNVFWGNEDGSIHGDDLDATDIVADPLFCSPVIGEFQIASSSPAAPAHSACSALIGAYPVGCGDAVTKTVTWGQIKKIYSE